MLSFIVNERLVQTDEHPGMVLLEFVRDVTCLSGTKEACREGECGACTVLVGTRRADGGVAYKACASCLLPIGDIDGCHVVTVEGLSGGELTLVQRLLVDHSASQCGFCTPGFVLSLTGFCLTTRTFAYSEALDALDGNLCRCTGYVAIRNAAKALCEHMAAAGPEATPGPCRPITELVAAGILPAYFETIPERLAALSTTRLPPDGPDGPADAPADAVLVAGGTDLFVQRPEQLLESKLDFLSRRHDLDYIRTDEGVLRIGGAVTLEDFRLSDAVARQLPSMQQDLLLHSSTILRNKATLTGNIVNASPVGDATIMLLALDASLVITRRLRPGGLRAIQGPEGGSRQVPLSRFFRGYKQYDLLAGELITEIVIPFLPPGSRYHFEKVSNRVTLDIAAVNSALRLTTDAAGLITDLRIAAGGVAPVPLLITGLEVFHGRLPDQATVTAIAQAVTAAVTPITDVRGSATYKRLLLGHLVRAHFSAAEVPA